MIDSIYHYGFYVLLTIMVLFHARQVKALKATIAGLTLELEMERSRK